MKFAIYLDRGLPIYSVDSVHSTVSMGFGGAVDLRICSPWVPTWRADLYRQALVSLCNESQCQGSSIECRLTPQRIDLRPRTRISCKFDADRKAGKRKHFAGVTGCQRHTGHRPPAPKWTSAQHVNQLPLPWCLQMHRICLCMFYGVYCLESISRAAQR